MDTNQLYDRLASIYHLIFSNWEDAIKQGAQNLDGIIRQYHPGPAKSVLDVSCGIGTQVIGLAELGYEVTGSDLSEAAVQRARIESEQRGLDVQLSVADMIKADSHHKSQFDVVMSCHNSVTHLQTESDILTAFKAFHHCVRDGGICLISVRDYDNEERGTGLLKPLGVRTENGNRYVVFQVWDFEGAFCHVSLYFVKDTKEHPCQTDVFRTRYFAIGITRLAELMIEAGFTSAERIDGQFDGPVIIGKK